MFLSQTLPLRKITAAVFALVALLSVGAVKAQTLPDDLDSALQNLISSGTTSSTIQANVLDEDSVGLAAEGVYDDQGRILVNIHLSGLQPLSTVHGAVGTLGGLVSGESSRYQKGLICAYMPISALTALANNAGVMSVKLALPPHSNNSVISGGAFAIHSDAVNAGGNRGANVKVGIISNSFNNNPKASTDWAKDVSTGDLPGPDMGDGANPDGDLTPVSPVVESPTPDSDEGRAMAQIVHDVAPGAALAFETASPDEATFAAHIIDLQTNGGCDIIVDDIIYFNEPMFQDGVIAQAVDTVTQSGAFYFSAAGNEQGGGWTSTFTPVSDATARAGIPGQNIKLNDPMNPVDTKFTNGGWHNFSTTPGKTDITQSFTVGPNGKVLITFQWNDPWDSNAHPVTTDYNVLVFDGAGNFMKMPSGLDKNTPGGKGTNEAIEMAVLKGGPTGGTLQIAITRRGTSPATPQAKVLRYHAIDLTADGGASAAEYAQVAPPVTYGHNCANGAIGVAAYIYDAIPSNPVAPPFTPMFEDYTSEGPSTIYFQADGTPLASPQVRQKPDIAAPDGGNTTFFPADKKKFDYEGDGFPNFIGTSAAAPHAAGVAALMLSKARADSVTLTSTQVRTFLQKSPLAPHDLDPFSCTATATTTSGGKVIVNGFGNDLNSSSHDPNFFTVTFVPGKVGETLKSVTIDLTNAGLSFDSTPATGFPFTLGTLKNIAANQITNNVPVNNPQFETLTLTFATGAFSGTSSVSFGVDRDFPGFGGGNHGDYLNGAQISAVTTKGTGQGTFLNKLGTGYSILDGWGFIDAQKAVKQVP